VAVAGTDGVDVARTLALALAVGVALGGVEPADAVTVGVVDGVDGVDVAVADGVGLATGGDSSDTTETPGLVWSGWLTTMSCFPSRDPKTLCGSVSMPTG
jgi:hypothetical protein